MASVSRFAFGPDAALQPDGYVFAHPDSQTRPRRPDTVTTQIRKTRERLGIDRVWLHGLRQLSVSELVEAGIDIRTIAERHGHADPAITLRVYAKSSDKQPRRAGEVSGGWLAEIESS